MTTLEQAIANAAFYGYDVGDSFDDLDMMEQVDEWLATEDLCSGSRNALRTLNDLLED